MSVTLNVLLVISVFGTTFVSSGDISIKVNEYCEIDENSITITATYTGTASVTYVEWYYSGDVSGTLIITASTCAKFANPTGYPKSTAYTCDTATKTFTLTLDYDEADLPKIFGATFGITPGSTAGNINTVNIKKCTVICLLRVELAFIIIGLFFAGVVAVLVVCIIVIICRCRCRRCAECSGARVHLHEDGHGLLNKINRRVEHADRPDRRIEHADRPDRRIEHADRPDRRVEHADRPERGGEH